MPLSLASLASLARVYSGARNGVRAKDAKVRKAISERFLDHTGWRACGVAGVTGLSEPGYNGGRWRGGVLAGGAIKDRGAIGGMFLYLRVQTHHA